MTEAAQHLTQDQRERIAAATTDHVPSARADQAAAINQQSDQARMVLFGSLGAMAVVTAALLATDRKVCLTFITVAYALLMLAAVGGWYAFTIVTAVWDARSTVQYTNLMMLRAAIEGADTSAPKAAFDQAMKDLAAYRNHSRLAVTIGACLGWWSFPALMIGVAESLSGRCSATALEALVRWSHPIF